MLAAVFVRPIAALARFVRARRGSTAVEFAIVALPFLILLFALLELGSVFMVSTTLEDATDRAARKIRTGEFQTSSAQSKQDFINEVCNRMSVFQATCSANLYVDVRTFENFTTASAAPAITGENFDPDNTCWSTGAPTDIVLVRTFLAWKLYTPLLDASLQNMSGGKRLIGAVATFRNEPYGNAAKTGAGC